MPQQKEIGTLVVVVLKAQHLHQPSFYKQNPYAQVSLSGLKKQTKVDPKGGQHPVWDDEFRFPVLEDTGKDKANRTLEVSCYKEEQRGEDVLLGKGTVDIEGTLKTGEFDDWIPLETSAGARGEVYLEMTFYANSPPPLMRRPSKLTPSDRLARPTAYFSQSRQSSPSSASPSPQREYFPAERTSQAPPTGLNQIPSSLIPARGLQSQPSRQPPSNRGATSAKHKMTSLPPLPANDSSDVSSGKDSGVPAALHPGGRSGPRPMPPRNRTRVTSVGRPPPEMLPEQLHRRSLSDTPALSSFSQLQVPMEAYSPETTSMTRARMYSTPSIVVEEHVEDHPCLAFPTSLTSSPALTQEHESRSIYAAGSYDSFCYEPSSQAYTQPISQSYIPAPVQGYSQAFSPSPRPMPPQSPYIPLGQTQQPYDMSSSPHLQQYNQYSDDVATPQPLSPPQAHPSPLHSSSQPQLPQLPQYPPRQQQPFVQQQQYLPPKQQQHHPVHLSYNQAPHPTNILQPCQQNTVVSHSQQSMYSQIPQQPKQFAVPPPPPVQSQVSQQYTTQPTPRPQSSFSPPPPPPPPPPPQSYNQGGQGSSPSFVVALSRPPVPPLAPSQGQTSPVQSVISTPILHSSPLSVEANNAPTSAKEGALREREEEVNGAQLDTTTEVEVEAGKEDSSFQGTQRGTDEGQKELGGQEEERRQEMECRIRDKEERKRQEEECRRKEEDECRRREDEERRRREEEELRKKQEREEEERKKRDQELKGREEEERRKKDDEERRKRDEERRRREEEEHRKQEEERKRRDEDERRKREEELRKFEEERRRREEEEAERRRKATEEDARRRAEEAEAERRWQEELARIRARAEQEAADAAFARAQMEAEEAERRRQEEADLALLQQEQEEAEREERLAQERRRQEEADMEVARREQAHEEELERRRREERRRRMEEADRELARRLDMELNLGADLELGEDQSWHGGAPPRR